MSPQYEFKVVLLGSVAVGKTAIANRLQYQLFESDYQPTIGAGFIPYRTVYNDKEIELQIWDTAGMERYKGLGAIYYRDAVAAVLVYDQSNPESADSLNDWLNSLRVNVKRPCLIFIVGNKTDLSTNAVDSEKMKEWCHESGFMFAQTSAKTGNGVEELFQTIIDKLLASSAAIEMSNENNAKAPKIQNENRSVNCC
ncbi:small GTP-binding protein [Tritrichomonas foetus]|uniref:Small GTP-binding protein n=1 Tax=Tritrichomonas foetus TaxID=1144522 RepID=A0A1J4IZS9_9EUKA|nr:small GTP-binding protein [Tritrichomonas foetus]|eukprot:OHS92856.1 small GTP-binding protein [Tritrichomonas foetus]